MEPLVHGQVRICKVHRLIWIDKQVAKRLLQVDDSIVFYLINFVNPKYYQSARIYNWGKRGIFFARYENSQSVFLAISFVELDTVPSVSHQEYHL